MRFLGYDVSLGGLTNDIGSRIDLPPQDHLPNIPKTAFNLGPKNSTPNSLQSF
jgi:hypothetical protein